MHEPTQVNWGVVALQLHEEALRLWLSLPALLVHDNCTGEDIEVYVDKEGQITGYRDEMAALFRRGFARDWLLEARKLRALVLKRRQLLEYQRLAS
jgi:hypothetical protein